MKMRMIEPNFWKGHGRYRVTKKALKELKRAGGEIRLGGNYVDTFDKESGPEGMETDFENANNLISALIGDGKLIQNFR